MTLEQRDQLRSRLLGLGFDVVRFAPAGTPVDQGLRGWLQAGHHAEMEWLARTAEKRLDAQLVLPGARTTIALGVNYWPGEQPPDNGIARYALHTDYHDTIRPGLITAGRVIEELCSLGASDYRYYVDSGPLLERGWAAAAGVGFRGKNGNLISRTHGNWLLLAAILVRAEIPPDRPLASEGAAGRTGLHCGRCTECLDACPTAAFPEPGLVDARRCISYHTIENRGFVPQELRAKFGARVFGCDECLVVCPWNRFAQAARSELLERRHDLAHLSLVELLELTPERFRAVFRGTGIKRTKLTGLLRNACIAAGNVWVATRPGVDKERAQAVAALERLARNESAVVRGHAVWALRRVLGVAAATAALATARDGETAPEVLAEYATPLP